MQRRISLIVLALVVLHSTVHGAPRKLPSGIKACSRNDPELNECTFRSATAAIPFVVKGIPSYGMSPMDPLHVDKFTIENSGSSQVAIDMDMLDLEITGLAGLRFKKFKMDNLAAGKVSWTAVIPRLQMIGQYTVKGRVLILPIVGNGPMNITLENVEHSFSFNVAPGEARDGAMHIRAADSKLDFTTSRCHIQLDNLFNGDKRLSEHMNVFLNENWREMVEDLGPPIAEVLNVAVATNINALMKQVPYDTIFPA